LDTLSPSQNAFVATALANYDGKIDLSTLTSILDHAKINAV
jgi:hypothetical protein